MIPGFEDVTYKLTEREKELLPDLIYGLSFKVGKGRIITNKQIREGLVAKYDKESTNPEKRAFIVQMKEPRIRKLVNFIRNKHLVEGLIATSRGYYVATDPNEILKYIKSLEAHEDSIRQTRKEMELYLSKLLNNGTKENTRS